MASEEYKVVGDGSLEMKIDTKGLTQGEFNSLAQKSIFRPVSMKESWLKRKYKAWLMKQLTTELSPLKPRFNAIHKLLKYRIVSPSIRLVKWLLRKHIVRTDQQIPKEWFNNHHRIFRHCFYKANEDMWKFMVFEQHRRIELAKGLPQQYPSAEAYVLDKIKMKHKSFNFRNDIIDIWLTEILEDSADREWLNFAMLRQTREMMRLYGVSEAEIMKIPKVGEYPIYFGNGPNFPPYFINNRKMAVWEKTEKELIEVQDEKQTE